MPHPSQRITLTSELAADLLPVGKEVLSRVLSVEYVSVEVWCLVTIISFRQVVWSVKRRHVSLWLHRWSLFRDLPKISPRWSLPCGSHLFHAQSGDPRIRLSLEQWLGGHLVSQGPRLLVVGERCRSDSNGGTLVSSTCEVAW